MFRRCAALGWFMIKGEDAKGRMERACDRIRPSLSGVPIRDSLSGIFLDCRGHIRRERRSTNSMRILPKSSKCCSRMGGHPWNQNSSERRRPLHHGPFSQGSRHLSDPAPADCSRYPGDYRRNRGCLTWGGFNCHRVEADCPLPPTALPDGAKASRGGPVTITVFFGNEQDFADGQPAVR